MRRGAHQHLWKCPWPTCSHREQENCTPLAAKLEGAKSQAQYLHRCPKGQPPWAGPWEGSCSPKPPNHELLLHSSNAPCLLGSRPQQMPRENPPGWSADVVPVHNMQQNSQETKWCDKCSTGVNIYLYISPWCAVQKSVTKESEEEQNTAPEFKKNTLKQIGINRGIT